ncbi:hypothetical protein KO528_15670 [Saccharophagus degradans]|uniref:hypothetical protein n=1 Tax=Saccharophagus degradans TaxID=86304 RepID=UPI001C09C8A6|nr:hypothetical protein [Saccharophagus degradans]MBU2986803.1 hypothetical protein [Saccharophagus degradans]
MALKNHMKIEFSEFPIMEKGYLIVPEPSEYLRDYGELYDRFCSAIYFAASIGRKSNLYMISAKAQAEGYLRASIADFISIEDLLRAKYPNDTVEYSLIKSTNPLFHFIKQLRNYNIHLSTARISTREISVIIASDKSRSVHRIDAYYIDNLDINEFLKLDCFVRYHNYTEDQFCRIIDLFNTEQCKFGVGDLLIRGILEYGKVIEEFLASRIRRSL